MSQIILFEYYLVVTIDQTRVKRTFKKIIINKIIIINNWQ